MRASLWGTLRSHKRFKHPGVLCLKLGRYSPLWKATVMQGHLLRKKEVFPVFLFRFRLPNFTERGGTLLPKMCSKRAFGFAISRYQQSETTGTLTKSNRSKWKIKSKNPICTVLVEWPWHLIYCLMIFNPSNFTFICIRLHFWRGLESHHIEAQGKRSILNTV